MKRERGIIKRHWDTRGDLAEEPSNVKSVQPSKIFWTDCAVHLTFVTAKHTCPQLGPGKAALRKFSLGNCKAFDVMTKQLWINAIKQDPAPQP